MRTDVKAGHHMQRQQWHCRSQTIADSTPLPSKFLVSANSTRAGSHKRKVSRAGGSHADALELKSAAGPGSVGCSSSAGMLGAAAPAAHACVFALRAAPPELRLHQIEKGAHCTRGSPCFGPCWTLIWCMHAGYAGWPCRLAPGYVLPSELCLRPLLAACCSSQVTTQDRDGQQYAVLCQMLICCAHA